MNAERSCATSRKRTVSADAPSPSPSPKKNWSAIGTGNARSQTDGRVPEASRTPNSTGRPRRKFTSELVATTADGTDAGNAARLTSGASARIEVEEIRSAELNQ